MKYDVPGLSFLNQDIWKNYVNIFCKCREYPSLYPGIFFLYK